MFASSTIQRNNLYPNFLSIIERQNVKLVLKVVNELIIAAFKLQNELLDPESRNNTRVFVDILLKIWKIFNMNAPFKGQRLNDDISRPLILQDERFSFIVCVVSWLGLASITRR